ncbi:hypothetical protein MAPG_03429 [Magnaporthiopsis poae ATCC 64411]|uniref:Uncharacterized protein n=1 Tax=Magnaporthiopsis poae (strain ATCC 64411 / 73-15) TaxID=644358 RepID=A0A0C4DTZ8_MAGP6|nr:hypothetical protein MAPG_03429 [Magnaporthiopsis poae ATCC 64411]
MSSSTKSDRKLSGSQKKSTLEKDSGFLIGCRSPHARHFSRTCKVHSHRH